jgi:hypothetical protein
MNDEIKIRVAITKGSLVLAELHSVVDAGRHEFVFAQPINIRGRHFEGFALECWLDQNGRHVAYPEKEIHLPFKR